MSLALLAVADSAESESVKLRAIESALDRAGLMMPKSVEVEVGQKKPWELLAMSITSIGGTREDYERTHGLPPAPAIASGKLPTDGDDEPLGVEFDDARAERRAERSARGPKDSGRPPGHPEPAYDRSEPITGERAFEEAARANREAGVWTVQRRRR